MPTTAKRESSKSNRTSLTSVPMGPIEAVFDNEKLAVRRGRVSLGLGLASLVFWIIPWAGFPLAFYGFFDAIRSRQLSERTKKTAALGIFLSSIGMIMSVANLVLVMFQGSSGNTGIFGMIVK